MAIGHCKTARLCGGPYPLNMSKGAGQKFSVDWSNLQLFKVHTLACVLLDKFCQAETPSSLLSRDLQQYLKPKRCTQSHSYNINKVDPLWGQKLKENCHTATFHKAPMKTNWPNRGKFESWVSSHSAIDHPCALHHQACFWMALWPLPRTAGGFFEPLFWTFPGCILLYFLPGRSPSGCLPFWLFVTY